MRTGFKLAGQSRIRPGGALDKISDAGLHARDHVAQLEHCKEGEDSDDGQAQQANLR